jgi:F-box-like
MWSPADKSALPTQKDLILAREAIWTIEGELELAQRRVQQLMAELDERRAWIAPIRKLSTEILSFIFVASAQDDWRSLLPISAVCGLWHNIALSTPRLWRFLELRDEDDPDLLKTYFEQSGQCLHHVKLLRQGQFTQLAEYADRIESIVSPDVPPVEVSLPTFIKLASLRITSNEVVNFYQLTRPRFPIVSHMELSGAIDGPYASAFGGVGYNFPPVKTLRLTSQSVARRPAWLYVLRGCRSSLTSLEIDNKDKTRQSKSLDIDMPLLQYLRINHYDSCVESLHVNLMTPGLTAYIQGPGDKYYRSNETLTHAYIDSVTHLRLDHVPAMEDFPLLRVFQLASPFQCVEKVFEQLKTNQACPALEHLEFRSDRASKPPTNEASLISWANKNRPNLRVLFSIGEWSVDIPGHIGHLVRA